VNVETPSNVSLQHAGSGVNVDVSGAIFCRVRVGADAGGDVNDMLAADKVTPEKKMRAVRCIAFLFFFLLKKKEQEKEE
jgi:hypothetical protein